MKDKTTLGKLPFGAKFAFVHHPDIVFKKLHCSVHSEFICSFSFPDYVPCCDDVYNVFNAYNGMEVYLYE